MTKSVQKALAGPTFLPNLKTAVSSPIETIWQQILFNQCGSCQQNGAKLQCSRCKSIHYCSALCQKEAWKAHKIFCIPPNPVGGTSLDLQLLLARAPRDEEEVCLFREEGGQTRPVAQQEFREMTGRTFRHYFNAPEEMVAEWPTMAPLIPTKVPIITPIQESIEAFERKKPLLNLFKVPYGLGVCAGEDIKDRQVVCLYDGEFFHEGKPRPFKSALYSHGDVDASLEGGLGGLFNDGPPNCMFVTLPNYRGIPKAPAIMAIRKISEGEQLLIGYGCSHALYEAAYYIAPEDYEKVKTFCLENKFYDPGSDLENVVFSEYLLSRLVVLARLLLDQTLSIEKTRNIFEKLNSESETYPGHKKNLISLVNRIEKILSCNDPVVIQKVIDSLLSDLRSITLLEIFKNLKDETVELTVECIEQYKIFGQLMDQIYLIMQGSIIGSYHHPFVSEKKPPITIDTDHLKTLFAGLSPLFVDKFKHYNRAAINYCKSVKWDDEAAALRKLENDLKSS